MIYATGKDFYKENENARLNLGGAKSDGFFYPSKELKRENILNDSLKDKSALPVFVEGAIPKAVETKFNFNNNEFTVIYGFNPVLNRFEPVFAAEKKDSEPIQEVVNIPEAYDIKGEGKYDFYSIGKTEELLENLLLKIKDDEKYLDIQKNPDFIKIFATYLKNRNLTKKSLEFAFENTYLLNELLKIIATSAKKDELIKTIKEEAEKLKINEAFINDLINGKIDLKSIGEVKQGKSYAEELKDEIEQIKTRIDELEKQKEDANDIEKIEIDQKINYFKEKLQKSESLYAKVKEIIERLSSQDVLTIYEIPSKDFIVDINNPEFLKFLEKNFFKGIDLSNIYKLTADYNENISSKNLVTLDQILFRYIKEKYFSDLKTSRRVVNYTITGQTINGEMFFYEQYKYKPITFYDKLDIIEKKEEEVEELIKLNKIADKIASLQDDKESFETLIAISSVLMQLKAEAMPEFPTIEGSKEDIKEAFKKYREDLLNNKEAIAKIKSLSATIYKIAEALKQNKNINFVKYNVLDAMMNESKAQLYYLTKNLNEENLNKVLMSIDNTLRGFSIAINAYKDFYALKADKSEIFKPTKDGERILGKGGVEIAYEEFKKLNYKTEIKNNDETMVYEPVVFMGFKLNPSKIETKDILKYGLIPVIGVNSRFLLDYKNELEKIKENAINLKATQSAGLNTFTKVAAELQKLNKENFNSKKESLIENLEFLLNSKGKKGIRKKVEELAKIEDSEAFKEKYLDLIPELKEGFSNLPDLSFTTEVGSFRKTSKVENFYEAKTAEYLKEALEAVIKAKDGKLYFKKGYEQTPLAYMITGDFTYPAFSKTDKKYLGRYMKFFSKTENNNGSPFIEVKLSEQVIQELLNKYGYKHKRNFEITDNVLEDLTKLYIQKTTSNENENQMKEESEEKQQPQEQEIEDIVKDVEEVAELTEEFIEEKNEDIANMFDMDSLDEGLKNIIGEEKNESQSFSLESDNEEDDDLTKIFGEEDGLNLFANVADKNKKGGDIPKP